MKYFGKAIRLLNIIKSLSVDKLVYKITSNTETKELIIRLNTDEQLFKGIDSTGRDLDSIGGSYSPLTIEKKKDKGQPYDRVTLKDTGAFYESFKVNPYKGGFSISADAIKDQDDLTKEWGDEIIGLTDASRNELVNHYRNEIIREIKRKLRSV
jgi:hypothetical protein